MRITQKEPVYSEYNDFTPLFSSQNEPCAIDLHSRIAVAEELTMLMKDFKQAVKDITVVVYSFCTSYNNKC